MNFLRRNKSLILLALLALILLSTLVFQYVSYHSLSGKENSKLAETLKQRIVVDLKNEKWFVTDNVIDGKIIESGEVKFSSSDDDEEEREALEVEPKDKPESIDQYEDDAYSKNSPEDDVDEKDDKPVVKVIEELDVSQAEISIIVSNMGLNENVVKLASRLPKKFTFAFTPYGQITTKASIQLAEEGYSVLAQLPTESTVKREDPGKFGLSPTNSQQKNRQNYEAVYSLIPSSIGFLTPEYEDFSGGSDEDMNKLLDLISTKNSILVYLGKSPEKVRKYAAVNGMDAIIPDLTIDNNPSIPDINAQLRALEVIAKERGSATALARAYPITFEALEKWAKTLEGKNIKLTKLAQR